MCELAARRLKRAEENDDVLRAVRELLYQRHKQLGAAEQQLAKARERIAELEDERPLIRALVVDAKRIIQNCKGYYHDDALALLGRAAAALKEE